MTVLTWAVRLILFLILLVFALLNTDPVALAFLPGQVWHAPLVIVLLAFFAGGAVLGVASLLGVIYRQRREIAQLRRAGQSQPAAAELPELPPIL
jgi:uncharacterized integral membrane protein